MRLVLLFLAVAVTGCSDPLTVGDEAQTIGASICGALERCNPGHDADECLVKYLDIVCDTVDCGAESRWTPEQINACARAIDVSTCSQHPPLEECKDIIGS